MRFHIAALVCTGLVLFATPVWSQQDAALDAEQAALLREFQRFEENLLKSSEASRRTDPDRAELLQRARGLSAEERIAAEMERIVSLLSGENARFGAAAESQEDLVASMELLLKLLQTENERDRLEDEKLRIEDLLKKTDQLIAKQRDLRADTNRGQSFDKLKQNQGEIAEDAGDLAEEIDQHDAEQSDSQNNSDQNTPENGSPQDRGDQPNEREQENGSPEENSDQKNDPSPDTPSSDNEPSPSENTPESAPSEQSPSESNPSGENQPPGEQQPSPSPQQQQQQSEQTPGKQNLQQAQEQMQRAIEALEKQQRDNAGEAQDEAVAELERLKAKLEEILRQLREEEDEILLAMLESRFQQMLQLQLRVNAATTRLDKTRADERSGPFLTSATQLSRDEGDILLEAEKALRLLREEGSSAAFPEAVDQMIASMRQVVTRLEGADVGKTTQLIETMIVESLEEMIVALQKELDDKQQQKQNSQGGQQPQGEQERALVDDLAELKLIRSLQEGVYRMTQQFDETLAENSDVQPSAEDREFLRDLARRQQRIQKITYELATKRTE